MVRRNDIDEPRPPRLTGSSQEAFFQDFLDTLVRYDVVDAFLRYWARGCHARVSFGELLSDEELIETVGIPRQELREDVADFCEALDDAASRSGALMMLLSARAAADDEFDDDDDDDDEED